MSGISPGPLKYAYVADLKLELAVGLPTVPGLGGPLHQVLLNLIVNAAHAIGESGSATAGVHGTITIATRTLEDAVELRVSDTGIGIPPEVRTRIFDPLYTTKEVGKGTGQGLALVHSVVVDQHRGEITVESEVGEGTTMIVRLPRRE